MDQKKWEKLDMYYMFKFVIFMFKVDTEIFNRR